MIIVSDKSCRQKQNTFCVPKGFSPENHAVYMIMWKNMVGLDRPQMTIWRMCFACWISMAANTHSEYAIFIAFPPQQLFRERPSILCCTYSVCPGVFRLKREAEVTTKIFLINKNEKIKKNKYVCPEQHTITHLFSMLRTVNLSRTLFCIPLIIHRLL